MADSLAQALEALLDELLVCSVSIRGLAPVSPNQSRLSLSQKVILETLEKEPGLTVPQLARRRGLSRQSVQVHINRLVHTGLLRPVQNPDHRRSARLQITASGLERLRQTRRSHQEWLKALSGVVNTEDVETSLAVIRRVTDLAGGRCHIPAPALPASGARRRRPTRRRRPSASQASAEPVPMPVSESDSTDELPVSLL